MSKIHVSDIEYIPSERVVYFDPSAFGWVDLGSLQLDESESHQFKIRQMTKVNKALKSRRKVIATPKVLEELKASMEYCLSNESMGRQAVEAVKSFGRSESYSGGVISSIEVFRGKGRLYKNLLETLVDNQKSLDLGVRPRVRVNPIETYRFVNRVDISDSSKELVAEALSRGHNTGIFSANRALIDIYRLGVNYYGLGNCFISDAILSKNYSIQTD